MRRTVRRPGGRLTLGEAGISAANIPWQLERRGSVLLLVTFIRRISLRQAVPAWVQLALTSKHLAFLKSTSLYTQMRFGEYAILGG